MSRNQKLVEAGLCRQCGVRSPELGKVSCSQCLRRGRNKYADRKASGLCTKCGLQSSDDTIFCEKCREENKQRSKNYADEHKTEGVERARRYRKLHGRNAQAENSTPAAKARKAEWSRNHPENAVLQQSHRRARKRNAKGTHTVEQAKQRIEVYGYKCYVCGTDYTEIDHVIPLAKGGSEWPANLRPICRSCNASKGAKHYQIFTT